MKKSWMIYTLLIGLNTFSVSVFSQPSTLTKLSRADACRDIPSKLERLQCFDAIFNTPVEQVSISQADVKYPSSWFRAVDSEKKRDKRSVFIFHQLDSSNQASRMWLTSAAVRSSEQLKDQKAPILMLECYEKITRAELILPTPVKAGKVELSIPGSPVITQEWMSDETGYVLRSGRGLPAIRAIKAMISSPQLILRSNVADIDHLEFDNSNLAEALEPMRENCRW